MSHIPTRPGGGSPIAASIEATPRQIVETDCLPGLFPAGTRVYLTDVGASTPDEFVAAARRIAECGHAPVPHFPARRIAGEADLRARLSRLTGEAGVDDVLVIAGSVDRIAGPYASTMDLLATGLFEAHGIRKVAVAGHPEGSADIADAALVPALAAKQAWAREAGVDMRIVTQFGFDAERFVAWADELAVHSIDLPVHIGVSGPAKITTLLKYAAMCGVGASLDFLKKRASSLVALATSYSPEAVVGPIEEHLEAMPLCPIAQVHVFPFGGLRKSAEWLTERGSWPAPAAADAITIAV